ncbi:uncharacterized protein LOC116261279 isoform X1 [Nymphaea colorata]|nr:uncharacterized protein LOC116261279 isoform X1 [Nymphaea colorata]XP_049935705.1 uncharacterized protein LOC116261279 isoform X1 [Nymphaea colorata]
MADNFSSEERATPEAGSEEKKENDGDDFREQMGSAAQERDSEERGEEMTPWEQHSSVISIPRFDYEAPTAILEHSHSGFLVTCTIKREKSATKEAIALLEKHINSTSSTYSLKHLLPPDINLGVKKRKLCDPCEERLAEDPKGDLTNDEEDTLHVDGNPFDENSGSANACSSAENVFPLSLVKLTRSGLLLFAIPRHLCMQNVNILMDIFRYLDSGDQKPPIWCHRILPFQGTCMLREKDLAMAVKRFVDQYTGSEDHVTERPLKFAVAFNRRGVEGTEMKQKSSAHDCHESPLLDRNECLRVVASAVKDTVPDSVVDLKSPQDGLFTQPACLTGGQADLFYQLDQSPALLFAHTSSLFTVSGGLSATEKEHKPAELGF